MAVTMIDKARVNLERDKGLQPVFLVVNTTSGEIQFVVLQDMSDYAKQLATNKARAIAEQIAADFAFFVSEGWVMEGGEEAYELHKQGIRPSQYLHRKEVVFFNIEEPGEITMGSVPLIRQDKRPRTTFGPVDLDGFYATTDPSFWAGGQMMGILPSNRHAETLDDAWDPRK